MSQALGQLVTFLSETLGRKDCQSFYREAISEAVMGMFTILISTDVKTFVGGSPI